MRALIVGCAPIGAMVAERLARAGHRVTVMDDREDRFTVLADELGIEMVVGDGTRVEDMARAGAREADLVIAGTRSDSANALAAQIARHVFQTNKVVCLVEDPELHDLYRNLGFDTVCPSLRALELIQRAVRS